MDLFATFSSIAGVPMPEDRIMDGVDLSPTLFEKAISPREEVFYYRGRKLFAVRVGDFKLHFITQRAYVEDSLVEHDPPLLFNLEEDPSEQFDIAAQHPEVVEQILQVVQQHRTNMVEGPDQLRYRGAVVE
jgi:arylsulfatase A-like enzyme